MTSRVCAGLPPHGRGQRIGLFGGSFNPPHAGHRAATLLALQRLQLDWVWWLVTPGNPLKDHRGLPPIATRMAAAAALADHPRIVVTGLEARFGSAFTYDILKALTTRCPAARFVWIMGADSFADFHRWKRWRDIAALLPMAVVDRPGFTVRAHHMPGAAALHSARRPERDAGRLADARAPAYVFLHGRRSSLSSTQLRSAGVRATTSL